MTLDSITATEALAQQDACDHEWKPDERGRVCPKCGDARRRMNPNDKKDPVAHGFNLLTDEVLRLRRWNRVLMCIIFAQPVAFLLLQRLMK